MASEDNVKLQLRQPWLKFGTDAAGLDPDNVHSLAHPRSYGNMTRVLGHYVREEHVLTLEDAIRKMTSSTANRLSIPDRGLVKEGFFADLVLFDPVHHRRPRHLRKTSSALRRNPGSDRQRRSGGPRRQSDGREAGPDRKRPRIPAINLLFACIRVHSQPYLG